jgi:hypothetical protein
MTRHAWIFALVLLVAVRARAGEAPADGARPSDWTFEIAPYAWVPGTYGTIDVDGRTAHLSVTPIDLLEKVFDGDALAGGAYASARWRRFSVFVDAFGGGVKSTEDVTVPTPRCDVDVRAKVRVREAIVDVGVGAEVGRWPIPGRRRPLTLGVYAGMRYVHLGNEIDATTEVVQLGLERRTEATATFDWADPLIGVRFEVPLHDRVSLAFRGDIGGFGASSDLAWGLVGDVRYWMGWSPRGARPWLGLGYRVAAFDRSGGDGEERADAQFRGPTAGVGFVF